MLHYNIINISEEIDPAKSNDSKECMICHYFFLIIGLNFKIMFVMVVMI